MNLSQFLMPEFQHEMANTRKMLEAIPETDLDYQSNKKAMSLVQLANHIAEIPTWVGATFLYPELDFSTIDYVPKNFRTVKELIAYFDENVATAQKLLSEVSNETLNENWTMKNGDVVYFTMPKLSVFRMFVMNHIIHHRGQMSAYIRAVGAVVPGMYGPTADQENN